MTAALLEHAASISPGPECPPWCTNYMHPLAATQDMCDAGGGDRWHNGRLGSLVLPSRVDEFYDEEIGVELYRYDNADGTLNQIAVLLTYTCEGLETGHVTLDVDEARRLVDLTRSDCGKRSQTRFAARTVNNIVVEHPHGSLACRVDMNVADSRHRLSLHAGQLHSLGDIVACACILAGVGR